MTILSSRIQESNATAFNRYPTIFSTVRDFVKAEKNNEGIGLLSFGCSTGEEVASLDSLYIENSRLVGVDVSQSAISKAKQYQPSGRNDCAFYNSSEFNYESRFDVVLALSVLCRWPESGNLESLENVYSFEEFSRQIDLIDELVEPGGLLVLHNTNYFFEDTEVFRSTYNVYADNVRNIGFVTRFDVRGARLDSSRKGHVFFRKRAKVFNKEKFSESDM